MELGKKVGRILALASMFVWMFTMVVFADTNCTISIIGGEELQPGEEVSVQVKIKAENEISDTDVFVTYDSSVVEYVSGEVSESEDGKVRLREYFPDGTKEHTWTLTFKAVGEGSTRMKAENCWIKHYDEEEAGSSTASVMVEGYTFNVSGDAIATEAPTEDAQATADPATEVMASASPTEEALSAEELELQALREEIANDGTMSCLVGTEKWMVQETFPDSIMPYHFQVSSQFYKGVEVKAAKLTNAEYYLVYVKSEDGSQDKFCMYQSATKEFFDIQKIQMSDQFVLYIVDPSDADIPGVFKETTLEVGAQSIRAWQLENQTQLSYGADPNQFYIVCGYNQNGVGGWYLYDSGMHSFQRYVELDSVDDSAAAVAENAQLKNNYNQLADKFDFMVECLKYVSVILIALLLLLLIVNITDKKDDGGKGEENKKLTRKEKKALKKAEKAKRKEEERKLLSDDWDKDEEETPIEEAVAAKETTKETKPVEANSKKVAPKEDKSGVEVLKPVTEEAPVKPAKEVVKEASANPAKEVAKEASKKAVEKKAAPVEKKPEVAPQKAENKDFSMTDSMEELSRQIQAAMNEEQGKKNTSADDLDDLLFINLDD